MKDIIDYFDRAYVINLRERKDRRRGVINEFGKFGIDIPSSKVRFFTATRPAEQAGFPTLGARGSFTSHRAILDLARQDQLRNVLVFEDDVRFSRASPDQIERIVDGLRQHDWDIVYFGYLAPQQLTSDQPVVQWAGQTTGGHFYGLNGRFIIDMAQYMHACELRPAGHPDGGPMFRDGAYNHVRYLNPSIRVFLSVPNLATQRSSRTDLHALKVYDRITLLAPLMRAVRTAKSRYQGFKTRTFA